MSERVWETNEHGVAGFWSDSGRFGRQTVGPDGQQWWQDHFPLFVPRCCLACAHYDSGEVGDEGSHLSPPSCDLNVWFPVCTGTCKRQSSR